MPMSRGTPTPWGVSQGDAVDLGRGLKVYSTAGHGGLAVSRGLARRLSGQTLNCAIEYGGRYWFEEDCDMIMPIYELWNTPGLQAKLAKRGSTWIREELLADIRRYKPWYKGMSAGGRL
jgi:hypothetical protein